MSNHLWKCYVEKLNLSLVSAAVRHIRDAEALLASSPDQAWHLAGFGPECMRKAVLTLPWAGKALGHDLDGSEAVVLSLVLELDPHARRYQGTTRLGSHAILNRWDVKHRYDQTGTWVQSAPELVATCSTEVQRLLASIVACGLLRSEVP
jgi:hypothetical protein